MTAADTTALRDTTLAIGGRVIHRLRRIFVRQLRYQGDEEVRQLHVGRDALNGQGGIALRGLFIHPVLPGCDLGYREPIEEDEAVGDALPGLGREVLIIRPSDERLVHLHSAIDDAAERLLQDLDLMP